MLQLMNIETRSPGKYNRTSLATRERRGRGGVSAGTLTQCPVVSVAQAAVLYAIVGVAAQPLMAQSSRVPARFRADGRRRLVEETSESPMIGRSMVVDRLTGARGRKSCRCAAQHDSKRRRNGDEAFHFCLHDPNRRHRTSPFDALRPVRRRRHSRFEARKRITRTAPPSLLSKRMAVMPSRTLNLDLVSGGVSRRQSQS